MITKKNNQVLANRQIFIGMIKWITLVLFLGTYATMIGCSDDDGGTGPDPDPQQEFIQKLGGTWTVSSVTRDGADVLSDFQGFSVTFTSSGYTTQNGGVAWTDSGSWSFSTPPSSDGSTATVTFDNSVSVTLVLSNNDQTLTVSFTIQETAFGSSRTTSLAGSYVFVLNK